jgi:hypothetical protein
MSYQKNPKFEMIALSNTSTYPRAVMIILSDTFSAKITMLTAILFPIVADRAKIVLLPLVLQKLVFLERSSLKARIFSNS